MSNDHDDGFHAEPSIESLGAPQVIDCMAALTWWRKRDPKKLGALLCGPDNFANLAMQVARARPAATEIARILDNGDGSALIGAVLGSARRRGVVRDSIANDLLASALLIEGLSGDATSQEVVDRLRKQRKLDSLLWPSLRRAAKRALSARQQLSPSDETRTSLSEESTIKP